MLQDGAYRMQQTHRDSPRARRRVAFLVLSVLLLLPATSVRADEPDPVAIDQGAAYATDRVIVRWRDGVSAGDAAQGHGLASATPLGFGPSVPVLVKTDGRAVPQVLADLRADPKVLYAEPDYVIQVEGAAVPVNDSLTGSQYSLDRMHVREAWSLSKGDSTPVAVLDTGVQYSHPDLAGRMLQGWDFVNGDANADDDNGHGTWVAGIIAANVNNSAGVAGITWSNPVLPVKIMNANGTGYTSNLALGIRWAADHGAGVINMSIGGFPASSSVADAVDYAWNKGVVLVGAAGNNGRLESHYPASFPHVISVSATQADDEFTKWSNYSPNVDVSAPGGSVISTSCKKSRSPSCIYDYDYMTISGTSFATPNTAAVVALIRAKNPSWTPQQVVDRLITTVDDLGYPGYDVRYGYGRVNAYRALGGSISATPVPPRDSLESNDTLGTARPLTLGVTSSPTIYPAGDVDHYTVRAPRAGRLDVTVTPVVDTVRPVKSALPVDVVVELLTTTGSRITRVDHSDPAATEVASVSVSSAQTVVVRVSNYYPNGSTAPYTIRAVYVDTVPPAMVTRTPSGGTADVNRYYSPTITFDESVGGVSSSSMSLVDDETGEALPAVTTYEAGSRTARVRPTVEMKAHHTYRVLVTGSIKDVAGNSFAGTSWTFTTGQYGFSDVIGSPFEGDIGWLAVSGITGGCSPDRFCPSADVTREQMASFLARAMELPYSTTDYFADDGSSPHEADINRIAAEGITGGCDTTRFCPLVGVTREQMASFLVRALHLPAATTDYFADDAGSPHEADINSLAQAGISAGCAADKYCPRVVVSRDQMAAFLHRAFGS